MASAQKRPIRNPIRRKYVPPIEMAKSQYQASFTMKDHDKQKKRWVDSQVRDGQMRNKATMENHRILKEFKLCHNQLRLC